MGPFELLGWTTLLSWIRPFSGDGANFSLGRLQLLGHGAISSWAQFSLSFFQFSIF
jgi:hypothetical protein